MNRYLMLFPIGLLLALVGQLLLKKGMTKIGEVHLFSHGILGFIKITWKMFTHITIIIGVFFFILSSLIWLIVLSGLELSYIYPMVSLNYVLAAFASRIFFKEKVTKMRWLSIAIIIFGVILISSSY